MDFCQLIIKILSKYYTFRNRHPNLLPKGSLVWFRPLVAYVLDLLTLNRGCRVKIADKWPLRVEWRRITLDLIDFRQLEREFIDVYASSLLPGDIIFDIGSEFGDWAALAATRTRGSQVHIFEPNRAAWKHIRKIWQYNRLEAPGGCWAGFVSNRSVDLNANPTVLRPWPKGLKAGRCQYESLLDPGKIASITVDDYVKLSGAKPTVLLIDVEGSEVLVLEGAIATLSTLRPIVFLSYHPKMISPFGRKPEAVMELFSSLGFQSHLVSVNYEEHWVFWDPQRRIPAITNLAK